MKTPLCALLIGLALAAANAADTTNSNILGAKADWTISFPRELTPAVEMTDDGPDGKPALKVAVPDGQIESWKGKISRTAPLDAPGNYTISFLAKAEPAASLEVSVWGSLPNAPRNLGPRVNQSLQEEWQEFIYSFSADQADPKANITFGNLARSGTTFFLSGLRIVKD